MSEPAAPSVNSWLEDELYHQYLYDRQTVDAGWKQVFDADSERLNPNGLPANGTTITIEPEFGCTARDEGAGGSRAPVPLWRWDRTIRRCRCVVPR